MKPSCIIPVDQTTPKKEKSITNNALPNKTWITKKGLKLLNAMGGLLKIKSDGTLLPHSRSSKLLDQNNKDNMADY